MNGLWIIAMLNLSKVAGDFSEPMIFFRLNFQRWLRSTVCRPEFFGLAVLLLVGAVTGCQALKPFQTDKRTTMTQRLGQQLNNTGLDALKSGRLAQAKAFFSRAAAENPQNALARINLARALRQENNLTGAIEEMQKGIELAASRDPKLITELGEMQLDAGHWLEANGQAERALQMDYRCASAWALKARVHQVKGENDIALANFQRAASLDPEFAGVQLAIAEIYSENGEPLRALSAIEKLLQKHPLDQQSEKVLLAKGEVLTDLQQWNAAIEVLQSACDRSNSSSLAFLQLANVQMLAGQISQARHTLQRGRDLHPEIPLFVEQLAALPIDSERVAVR
jgi:tetratricopeptide (TPR) repeat protein